MTGTYFHHLLTHKKLFKQIVNKHCYTETNVNVSIIKHTKKQYFSKLNVYICTLYIKTYRCTYFIFKYH